MDKSELRTPNSELKRLSLLKPQVAVIETIFMEEQEQGGPLNIELTEEIADGIYSNLAVITHSNSEFVIDFISIMPGVPKAKVRSRILLTPVHAKRLLRALKENVTKFESLHGAINDTDMPNAYPLHFGAPKGQA